MDVSALPCGAGPDALHFPWFPTAFQAVIFRNWGMVPVSRLAKVLRGTEQEVLQTAETMGLAVPPEVNPLWLVRGYVSLIRINWHLLGYPQLLELLDWDADRLNNTLQTEDFLWHKLGLLKPRCPEVRLRKLTAAEKRATEQLRAAVRSIVPAEHAEPAFGFLKCFTVPEPVRDGGDFDLKMAYSYSALYGDALSMPELDPYPDALLACLAARGVNAIWLQTVLYQLYPWKDAPELSKGGEKRLAELRKLTERAAKHGMKVIVYLNEPRGVPYNLFADRKDIVEKYLGADEHKNTLAFCTSKPAARQWLADAVEYLFRQVPGLGGAFTISQSENLTHCRSRQVQDCPRCAKRTLAEIIAEVNTIICNAAHKANPQARIICWSWAWPPEIVEPVIAGIPDSAAVMAVSESRNPFKIGKIRNIVQDYSISHAGPSPSSLKTWSLARKRSLACVAKVQLSNTWEGSSVPYIPVTRLVADHLKRLKRAGVRNLMLSWTLGGYPSLSMDLLNMNHRAMVKKRFGAKAADAVEAALDAFSTAFKAFPFDVGVVYNSPHNIGPANFFYPEPTGFRATMVGIPYDDLSRWKGPYPVAVYLAGFRKLCAGWKQGLKLLAAADRNIAPEYREQYEDLCRVAKMCYLLYSGTVRQIRYVQLRKRPSAGKELAGLLKAEENAVREMLTLAETDSRFGFEATNHYAYTLNELKEKIVNLRFLQKR